MLKLELSSTYQDHSATHLLTESITPLLVLNVVDERQFT